MLVRIAPGAFAVIFVICLSSFAVALTLGGGPRATTVELAIYQAMRFDFDLSRAALLALLQLLLALLAGLVALKQCEVLVQLGLSHSKVAYQPPEALSDEALAAVPPVF